MSSLQHVEEIYDRGEEIKMKYPKTLNYWKRDSKGKLLSDVAKEEFKQIKTWRITEKIDGTNVRILLIDGKVIIGSRRYIELDAKFNMHQGLLDKVKSIFTEEAMNKKFPNINVVIFGEGFGAKIQSGGRYRSEQDFILFDVVVYGKRDYWLNRNNQEDIATHFGVEIVPEWNEQCTIEEIIDLVKNKVYSTVSDDPKLIIEGVIARTDPLMFFQDGTPIKFKMKVKDLEKKQE